MEDLFFQNSETSLRNFVPDFKQLAFVRRAILDDGRERGVRIADFQNGSGLSFTVILDRGMDIGQASFKGIPLAFILPPGFVNPAACNNSRDLDWLSNWGGGLLTGCGLQNVGSPCEYKGRARGVHGKLSSIPAENISVVQEWIDGKYILSVSGLMKESRLFAENLRLTRKISSAMGENTITIEDCVHNCAPEETHYMQLYHINLGFPLISPDARIISRPHDVEGVDANANSGLSSWYKLEKPQPGLPEKCFYHDIPADDDGFARIALLNQTLGIKFTVEFRKNELPYLTQWKQMGARDYALGLEPCNCHVRGGAAAEESAGTLRKLKPDEKISNIVRLKIEEL